MYAKIKTKYQFQWINLQKIYDINHEWAIFYLKNDLLLIYKKKFVKCWINCKLHFNNYITFCDKKSNATLKHKLEFFIDDLKSVVDNLKLLLMNQHHDYIEIIQMTKIRLSFYLWALILRDLVTHVISFALHKIIEQYKLIMIIEESLSLCINIFITTLNLSCTHKIQRRMYNTAEDEVLKIEDIHLHWCFEDSAVNLLIDFSESTFEATSETFNVKMNYDISTFFLSILSDSLLQVQNFAVVRSKNRFVEARERQDVRRQQEFKISTQREFSQYEHVLMKTKQQELQQRMKQRRDRDRDRNRGLTRARGEEQRGERAATFPFIQTDAGLFAAFHM